MDSNPPSALNGWFASLYRGEPDAIGRFLDEIDATLPSGGTRDLNHEHSLGRPGQVRCYLFDLAGDATARLWLRRPTPTRVRGGPVDVIRYPPSDYATKVGRLIADFADGCVLPAARAAGVRRTRPSFGARSSISHSIETRFNRLADAADGRWPLADRAQEEWEALVSECLDERVGINRDELERWIADSGWVGKDASAIVDRFFEDSRRMADQLERLAR